MLIMIDGDNKMNMKHETWNMTYNNYYKDNFRFTSGVIVD